MRIFLKSKVFGLLSFAGNHDVDSLDNKLIMSSLRANRSNPEKKFIAIIFLILLFISQNSHAFVPEQHLPDHQEQRARELFLQIKCPVCAGQVIESSNTEISFQLRSLVREKIMEGKSDDEIKADLIKEYGEEILNYPTSNIARYVLWILPFTFIFAGVFVIKKFIRFR